VAITCCWASKKSVSLLGNRVMKVFLSIKFWGDNRNRRDIEEIIKVIENAGVEVFCFIRDAEQWGGRGFEPQEMMELTFKNIQESDFIVANVVDWPIGVGVEAGYAYAKGIPIICIYPEGSKAPGTVVSLARHIIEYTDYADLGKKLKPFL
jgi:nucleoside 2-deoxyribosyltransferase